MFTSYRRKTNVNHMEIGDRVVDVARDPGRCGKIVGFIGTSATPVVEWNDETTEFMYSNEIRSN